MTDDLEKYEVMARHIESDLAADAITELVAMVRSTREDLNYAEELVERYLKRLQRQTKRAEAAERDAQEAAANTLHALHQLAELKRRMR